MALMYAISITALFFGAIFRGRKLVRVLAVLAQVVLFYFAFLGVQIPLARPEARPYDRPDLNEAYIRGAQDGWRRAEPSAQFLFCITGALSVLALLPSGAKSAMTSNAVQGTR
jgi:hypothetical protein